MAPPSVARTDELGEGSIVAGSPRVGREEALQERLYRREVGKVDLAERVASEERHRGRRESARGHIAAARVTHRKRHYDKPAPVR